MKIKFWLVDNKDDKYNCSEKFLIEVDSEVIPQKYTTICLGDYDFVGNAMVYTVVDVSYNYHPNGNTFDVTLIKQ